MTEAIPIHAFTRDDEHSIPFELVPLTQRTGYDTSVPHRHNYFEIFMFEKGGGTHQIDFEDFAIKDHSIHFISPGQVHHVQRANNSHGWVILFSRDFYHTSEADSTLFEMPFFFNRTPEPLVNLKKDQYQNFHDLTLRMQEEYKKHAEGSATILRAYLTIFITECKRIFPPHPQESTGENLYLKFRTLLEKEFHTLHQVNQYAAALGVSDKQLNEVIKKARGTTCSDLIHERLILESKRLLLHADLSVKEIAYYLHFEDPSHFGKFFKKHTGHTPAQFRKEG